MKKWFFLLFSVALFSPDASPMAQRPARAPENIPEAALVSSLTLEEAYQCALQRSEDLAIRKIDIDETWADFLEASGQAIGDMSFQFLHQYQEPQNMSSPDGGATSTAIRSLRRTRQFVISQPLFQGLKTLGAMGGAKNLRSQKVHERQRAEQMLFLEVATAFYLVRLRENDVVITEQILKLLGKRISELAQWERIGKSRPSEIVSARALAKRSEADLARRRGQLAVDRRILEFLTGLPLEKTKLEEPVSPKSSAPEDFETFISSAGERADVIAARNSAQAYKNGILAAQSGLWPDISLDGRMYEKREGFQSGIDWDVLFTVNVPIYQGGETLAKIKRAAAEYQKAKLNHERTLRLAETEIKRSYDAWISSLKEDIAMQEAVTASEENYRLLVDDYDKRLADNLDVLAALEILNNNRLEANRTHYESLLNYLRLQVAAGNCCEPF